MDQLNSLLNELYENPEMPPQALLYHFSNLESKDILRVDEVWIRLPVALRRKIIVQLAELAEADFEVNFDQVFRLGLKDEDAQIRTTAIEGLWEDEDSHLIPILINCLRKDTDISTRAAAATSLGRFVLLGELEKIRHDPYAQIYEALLTVCQDQEEDIKVQRRALESLSYVSNKTIKNLIHQAYAAPEEKMHISAVFSMGRSADVYWAKQVRQELFQPSPELRYEAARACGELQLREAVPELEELAEDADPEVQEAALWALGQVGGEEARQILERYCRAKDEASRTAAEAAMDELEFLHGDLSEFLTKLITTSDGDTEAD
ncbi:MAG: HEAT repeat domain-containing protein [Chloroflexi bacterium]|nr:HEAT repeat domain-containing protein [Chloroflexota bacterium]